MHRLKRFLIFLILAALVLAGVKLVQQGNISQEVFDQTRSDLQQARSELKKADHQLKQLQTRRDYTRLKTGMNGRIQKRLLEPGDMAQPGKPVMLLEDVSAGYNVHIRVPATVQAVLQPGREIILSSGGEKREHTSNVSIRLQPRARPCSRSSPFSPSLPLAWPAGPACRQNWSLLGSQA